MEGNGILKPPAYKVVVEFDLQSQKANVTLDGITNLAFADVLLDMAKGAIQQEIQKAMQQQQMSLSPSEKAAIERTLRR